MDYDIKMYDLDDLEEPSKEFTRFARKVELLKMKEEKPDVKPEKVFEGYKKSKSPPRKSKRLQEKTDKK